jgi:tetratricopeptide (TPR) repeat protein
MMALCHKEIGESLQAVDVLEKAIASPQYNDHRHLVVKYELGVILEIAGRKEEALRVFSQVHDTDATYRDVAEKVLSLQKGV